MRCPRCDTELLDANETIGFCPKCRVLQTHTHPVTNDSPNSSVRKGSDDGPNWLKLFLLVPVILIGFMIIGFFVLVFMLRDFQGWGAT